MERTSDMSEYVEKCPCCNNHSLEVTQHVPRGEGPTDYSRAWRLATKASPG